MKIVRWVLAVALALVVLMLALANKALVTFVLPSGEEAKSPLWLLLMAAFAAGWLPTWLYHLGARANWKRRQARPAVLTGHAQALDGQAAVAPPAGT